MPVLGRGGSSPPSDTTSDLHKRFRRRCQYPGNAPGRAYIGTGAKHGNTVVVINVADRINFLGENGTWNATIPHAWAANDVVAFQFEYEVA